MSRCSSWPQPDTWLDNYNQDTPNSMAQVHHACGHIARYIGCLDVGLRCLQAQDCSPQISRTLRCQRSYDTLRVHGIRICWRMVVNFPMVCWCSGTPAHTCMWVPFVHRLHLNKRINTHHYVWISRILPLLTCFSAQKRILSTNSPFLNTPRRWLMVRNTGMLVFSQLRSGWGR